MNLILTPRLFLLFRILVQLHRLAWTLHFRVYQSLQCFNQSQYKAQPVRLTNTGNLYSAPVLRLLPVWLATVSRFCNRFHHLTVPLLQYFRLRNLPFSCHNPHLPNTLIWCLLPVLLPALLPSTLTNQHLGSLSTDR